MGSIVRTRVDGLPEALEAIRLEVADEGWATIVLDRPDKLNALSIRMRREIAAAVDALEADPAVRVLILTGAGHAFTAGLDLDEWAAPGLTAAGAYVHDAVEALRRFSGAVIGAVNGACITGGLEIALACDVLLAAREARFADTHAHVGLLPGWGGSARLVRRVGLHRAKELAFTGRFLSADEALAWGLVNRVVDADRLQAEAEALARQMLACVPETLVAYKRLLDGEAELPLREALALERTASRANNEGVPRAVIDERLGRLKGRRR